MTSRREEIQTELKALSLRYQRGKLSQAEYEAEKAELDAELASLAADVFHTGVADFPPAEGWFEGGIIGSRYRLRVLVGRGGMAEVWQAEDTAQNASLVALKRLLAPLAEHPSLQQRLAKEISILRRLQHPRLIRLLDAPSDLSFFAMEYLQGQTLRPCLSSGRLPLLESLRLVGEICEGLAALHAEGIIHRDLKPENLFLVSPPPFSLKILDVGIAFDASISAQTTTKHGKLGTAYYMAPEQLTGGPITFATDLYALGILLYEMIAGFVPLPGCEPLAAEVLHLQGDGKLPPSEFNAEIEAVYRAQLHTLSDLAASCQKRQPEKRPSLRDFHQTTDSCRHALQEARRSAIQSRETSLKRFLLRDTEAELQTFLEDCHTHFPEHQRWRSLLPRLAEDRSLIEDTAAALQPRLGVDALEKLTSVWFELASLVEAKGAYLRHPFHHALRTAFDQEREHLQQIDLALASDETKALQLLDSPPTPSGIWLVRRLELLDLRLQTEPQAEAERLRAAAEAERLDALRKQAPPGFVWCPPGTFRMGSDDTDPEANDDEKPARDATLTQGFWMKATPVTQAEWQAVANFNPSHFKEVGPNAPVESVSWFGAVWFCNQLSKKEGLPPAYFWSRMQGSAGQERFKLQDLKVVAGSPGYRLPTEAEWEYACRAGTTSPRYGEIVDAAWYKGNSGLRTHLVGEKQPNAWGLRDMLGNVWEWCFDVYDSSYADLPTSDPLRTSERTWRVARGVDRVIRGGSWYDDANLVRTAQRDKATRTIRFDNLGFRLLRYR